MADGSSSQSVASMRVHMYTLPFLIGHFISRGNEHWMNFLRLLQINIICFSSVVSSKTITFCQVLTASHNWGFVGLYPQAPFITKDALYDTLS